MADSATFVEIEDSYFADIVKGQAELTIDDKFGARLREERRRLKLNQTDFAALGGAALGSQTRYESGQQVPSSDYLSGLASNGVDVLYVLTGDRDCGRVEDPLAGELMHHFLSLPPNLRAMAVRVVGAMNDEASPTLHEASSAYSAE